MEPTAQPESALAALGSLPATAWLRTVPYAAVAALAIGVPSDLIDTPIFGRPVPVRPLDYVIWAVTSALIGLVFAVRRPSGPAADTSAGAGDGARSAAGAADPGAEDDQTRAMWGGFVSFLSVGCPVCNQAVVALVGTSGALSWWAPVQPLIGLAAVALLVVALRKRLRTYQLTSCPLPRSPRTPA